MTKPATGDGAGSMVFAMMPLYRCFARRVKPDMGAQLVPLRARRCIALRRFAVELSFPRCI